jgi:predicted acyl esterase
MKASTPEQPVLLHRREKKIKRGEIVELNIEIWPGSTHFSAGEGLRLIVHGTDMMVLSRYSF